MTTTATTHDREDDRPLTIEEEQNLEGWIAELQADDRTTHLTTEGVLDAGYTMEDAAYAIDFIHVHRYVVKGVQFDGLRHMDQRNLDIVLSAAQTMLFVSLMAAYHKETEQR